MRIRAGRPYSGTIFISPNIITSQEPSTYVGSTYARQGIRNMFDRRLNAFADFNAYLFNVTFADGFIVEFEVNPEFGSSAAAQVPVEYYAPVIGRLPNVLRKDLQTVWMHMGDQPFGGGNNNILIHTGSIAQSYIDSGILEEALAHEASHASLDAGTYPQQAWLDAVAADPGFISTYARDNPTREDVAESFVPWLAVTLASHRINPLDRDKILAAIPNRLAFFDAQHYDLSPLRIFASGFE